MFNFRSTNSVIIR